MTLNKYLTLKGDRTLWVAAILLALVSLFPVYSASSNIAFSHYGGSTFSMLSKHVIYLIIGLACMFAAHHLHYRYFGIWSKILLPLLLVLLIYTLFEGVNVSNASRWVLIPVIDVTFQSSALAFIILPLYLARYLALAENDELKSFSRTLIPLIAPIAAVCLLILPANFSTAAMLFTLSMLVLFIGGYPLKNILSILAIGVAGLALFILSAMAFPDMSNRVDTWKHRVENFRSGEAADNYQVQKAKMAIAEGQLSGKGPGKSVQKNFLPQSNSDFIYAIIVEEFGLIGGVLVVLFYVMILIRILIIATRASTQFATIAAVGVGMGIMMQAFVNLGVAVNLFPVTGQTLPLISAGGSSVLITCISLGILLSISRTDSEDQDENIREESEQEQGFAPEEVATEKLAHD